jgi:hypothetical protein
MTEAFILWRRLDAPGHDACRLDEGDDGWTLRGTAVYRHDGVSACLDYGLVCDGAWHSRQGRVRGWIGDRLLDITVKRTASGLWTLDGAAVTTPDLEACVDLDLGFTPATNTAQLRRLALGEGQGADAPVAWLDVTTHQLQLLQQRYERRPGGRYWYEAPAFGYADMLEVDAATGFVRRYPGLWEAER